VSLIFSLTRSHSIPGQTLIHLIFSHFVRHMLPHVPAMHVDPCLRKGECEIFRRSVVPILHKDWHRKGSLFRFLNLRVRVFRVSCLPFAKLIHCSDLCQAQGRKAQTETMVRIHNIRNTSVTLCLLKRKGELWDAASIMPTVI